MSNNVLTNTYSSSLNNRSNWGRTDNNINNNVYITLSQLSCNVQSREGIINVIINMGEQLQPQNFNNPEILYPQNKFKYNLFDSYDATVILLN